VDVLQDESNFCHAERSEESVSQGYGFFAALSMTCLTLVVEKGRVAIFARQGIQ